MNRLLAQVLVTPLLPLAVVWVRRREARILRDGRPLTGAELANARLVGVAAPERVRVLAVPSVFPWEWKKLTRGVCYRYGIVVRQDCAGELYLVGHECAHTAQYERLGGIREFLRPYLLECLVPGYPFGPLEQEAVEKTARLQRG